MNAKTSEYLRTSRYQINQFAVTFFKKGSCLGWIYLDEIPEDREPGASGEITITFEEDVRLFDGIKHIKVKKGTECVSRIDAICGRLKKEYQLRKNSK